jgi:hypothetical protein
MTKGLEMNEANSVSKVPSIAELQRVISAMTPGQMKVSPSDHLLVIREMPDPGWTQQAVACVEGRWDTGPANTIGIVALCNAAPTLLEIAAAALAVKDAERNATRVRSGVRRKRDLTDADVIAIANADTQLVRCRDAYDAALAKVAS